MFKQKNRSGWFVGWYEGGNRHAKALPTKVLAEHYRNLKYVQLNSDVFTGTIEVGWTELIAEYVRFKQLQGLADASIAEIKRTLNHFYRITKVRSSKRLNQSLANNFVLARQKEVRRDTLNKDIRNLNSFFLWASRNRYATEVKLRELKTSLKPVRSLSPLEIRSLIKAAKTEPTIYIRVVFALITGLRRGDIEKLLVSDVDVESGYVVTFSKKTGKSLNRPLPSTSLPYIKKHIDSVPGPKLFDDYFTSKKWNRVRRKAKLESLKFHDLRKTFSSVLLQRGVSTAVVQTLLEHSTPNLTHRVYANVDPVLKSAIELIPANDWLE